ncbi:MAG: ferredoxin [Candidatus Omnitrophota bacterium]
MRAIVDPDTCIGCELCTQTCPEVFAMKEDKAVAYVEPVPADVESRCELAAEECPVAAIEVQ